MKVKCIENNGLEKSLTIDKIYDVINVDNIGYLIINDRNIENWYIKERFKPAVAEIRNDTINKLLSDDATNVI